MTPKIDAMKIAIAIDSESPTTSGDGDSFLLLTGGLLPTRGCEIPRGQAASYLIGRSPAICGGAPVMIGTRITVHHLVEAVLRLGDRGRLMTAYPHLSADQIDAALEYYSQHAEEIDELIEEDQKAEFCE